MKFEKTDGWVFEFDDYIPHEVKELICIGCKYRFIDVSPCGLVLKDMVCPECGKTGYLICTGQDLEGE